MKQAVTKTLVFAATKVIFPFDVLDRLRVFLLYICSTCLKLYKVNRKIMIKVSNSQKNPSNLGHQ